MFLTWLLLSPFGLVILYILSTDEEDEYTESRLEQILKFPFRVLGVILSAPLILLLVFVYFIFCSSMDLIDNLRYSQW